MSRIALIHATMLSIPPSKDAFDSLWPEADIVHLLDDSLSRDRLAGKETAGRIVALADYALSAKVDAILFSCSAFGEAIGLVQRHFQIPVLKPNEAMFDAAFSKGLNLAMLATFRPSIESMGKEFYESAPEGAVLETIFVNGAREACESGNQNLHDRFIAEAAGSLQGYDAIMLAHFSMSTALERCKEITDIPILTAPESAVEKLKAACQE